MEVLINTAVPLTCFYQDFSGIGVTGLTVTVDIWNPSNSQVVTNGSATTRGSGFYDYSYTPTVAGFYRVLFKVAVTTVVQQQLALGFSCVTSTGGATAEQVADAVWDEVLTGATHNIATSAGRRLRQIASNIIIDGVTVSATANTIVLDADASSTNGAYDPGLIYIVSGTGAGQSRIILEYTGATKTAIVNRDWKAIPDGTSGYVIGAYSDLQCVNEGKIRAATTNTIQLNANASTDDDAYNGQAVFLVSGTGQDQLGVVRDYVGSTQTATIYGTWAVTPDTTTGYIMLPLGLDPALSLMYDNSGDPTPIVIPVPSTPQTCRVYEYAYTQDGSEPLATAHARARITNLPFDYNGVLHDGEWYDANTTTPDGNGNYVVYWDLPWTAEATVILKEHGVQHKITVEADTTQARVADLIAVEEEV